MGGWSWVQGLRVPGDALKKRSSHRSLCWRVWISQPLSFQCCSNRLLFVSFPGLCYNTNHSDFELSFNLSSSLRLEHTAHISTQAATGDIQQGKKHQNNQTHKASSRLAVPSPPVTAQTAHLWGPDPSFQTQHFSADRNSHAHSMVQKMIKAKQVLNIKIDGLFCS